MEEIIMALHLQFHQMDGKELPISEFIFEATEDSPPHFQPLQLEATSNYCKYLATNVQSINVCKRNIG
jgi:hypothetical protein